MKKELNAALVWTDLFQHLAWSSMLSIPNTNTSNDSLGRSDSKSKLTGTGGKEKPLKNEMLEQDLLVEITGNITSLFDNITHYPHLLQGSFVSRLVYFSTIKFIESQTRF